MLGLIYFVLCITVGITLISLFLPSIYGIMRKTYTGKKIDFPSLFVVFPAAVVFGTLIMAWPTYILACFFSGTENPLSIANAIVMTAAAVFSVTGIILLRKRIKQGLSLVLNGIKAKDLVFLGFITALVSFIMILTLYINNGKMGVGVSVYSDFAPHMGMIRSFSHGNNFPTSYSHFAGEDIKYHFMFQFLVGNLEYLGLRIDFAFNLPSIVCLVCVCMLLYALTVKLFGKRTVGMLAVLFFLFRSGSALVEYVSEIDGSFKEIFNTLKSNSSYIGKTEHEDWGLWNLNVYVNQRHLAFGMSMIILTIILMLEPVFDSFKRIMLRINTATEELGDRISVRVETFIKALAFSKEGWLVKDYKTPIICGLVLGLGAFFNGACVIAGLLVLFVLAFITDRRLEYLITAVIAVALSYVQSSVFINGSVMDFRWEPGFLAEVKTFFGTIKYMNMLLGILTIVLIASFIMVNGWYKWILLAFITPIIFALTFQMTTDVAVNHKYIMIGCMLAGVFAAALVYRVYTIKGAASKVIAVLLVILLTCTGVYDFNVLIKKNAPSNSGSVLFDIEDPVTLWIMENATADDIFLTDWYSLNNVVLGGAMLYYGWPYYAWSAGYDTPAREEQAWMMYEASNSETLKELTIKNNIRFIVVDRNNRTNENYSVREDVIAATFESVYTKDDGDWKFSIYDTEKVIN